MSDLEQNEIKEIQTKIKHHIDELEEKVKNSKIYWKRCETNFDTDFVQNFIDGHYNEIVNHLSQIKHHLEKITHHKNEIQEIHNFLATSKNKEDTNISAENQVQADATVIKRSPEDKLRSLNLRSSKTSSLKYVIQWEKMLSEQKGENPLNSIKNRLKDAEKLENAEDVPKIMVKSRVLQFEGFQKPKRVSPTAEAFLYFSGEKPKKVRSYPILDDIADEEDVPERPKSCDFEFDKSMSNGDCDDLKRFAEFPRTEQDHNMENDDDDDGIAILKVSDSSFSEKGDHLLNSKEQMCINNSEKNEEQLSHDKSDAVTSDQNNTSDKVEDIKNFRGETLEKVNLDKPNCETQSKTETNKKTVEDISTIDGANYTKPRIVQIHYKQNVDVDSNS